MAQDSPIATASQVSRTFDEVQALRGLDLAIPKGIVGVLGPNGAGKSTLFRLLLGLDQADQGDIVVLGHRMPDDALQVRAKIGYMPEDDSLFPGLDGLQQVVLAAQLCGLARVDALSRAHQVLDLVGLTDARYRLAAGYSLGMRQRLRLAMAVVHGPELLLLDEPTAGLDPDGRAQMLALIQEIAGHGVSILLSTHVLSDVEAICQYIVLISRGQLGFAGDMARFRAGSNGHTWRIGVLAQADRLVEALREQGIAAQLDRSDVLVEADVDQATLVWQAIAKADVAIHHFGPLEEDMGSAFVRHLRLDDPLRRQGQDAVAAALGEAP